MSFLTGSVRRHEGHRGPIREASSPGVRCRWPASACPSPERTVCSWSSGSRPDRAVGRSVLPSSGSTSGSRDKGSRSSTSVRSSPRTRVAPGRPSTASPSRGLRWRRDAPRALTNGWVPWNVLVGPDGKVVFSRTSSTSPDSPSRSHRCTSARPWRGLPPLDGRSALPGRTVVLGGGTGGSSLPVSSGAVFRQTTESCSSTARRSTCFSPRCCGRWSASAAEPVHAAARAASEEGHRVPQAEVEALDLGGRSRRHLGRELGYDSLVVSLGAELAPETVRGFDELAYNLFRRGCAQIHKALQDVTEGVVGILIPALPYKCPAAPYEAAFLAEAFIRSKGVRRNVEIHLTPEHAPMPVAPAALGDSIADLLAARGIHYHPLFTFQELRPGTREVVASDGRAYKVDLLMVVPPHRAPEVIRSSPLPGVSGFVHVDPSTLETDYDNVLQQATSRRSSFRTARRSRRQASSRTPKPRSWHAGSPAPMARLRTRSSTVVVTAVGGPAPCASMHSTSSRAVCTSTRTWSRPRRHRSCSRSWRRVRATATPS